MIQHAPAQVCPLCGHDDLVELVPSGETDQWLFACTNHQPSYNWAVAIQSPTQGQQGITAEIGMYDDLLLCVKADEPCIEHGVVEYRYQHLRPKLYEDLVAEFGHRAHGPRNFSVSALMARALGQLRDEGLLSWQYAKATGFWSYNGSISYWAKVPAPSADDRITWEQFAVSNGLNPDLWKLDGD